MTDVVVPFSGWGRAGFGELAWGEGSVAVGFATGEVGSVAVTTTENVSVSVTGVSGSGEVGTATVEADGFAVVTGVAASGEVGSVTVSEGSGVSVNVTGVEAVGAVGTAGVQESVSVSVTGVEATGGVGSVSIVGEANVSVTGVSGNS